MSRIDIAIFRFPIFTIVYGKDNLNGTICHYDKYKINHKIS